MVVMIRRYGIISFFLLLGYGWEEGERKDWGILGSVWACFLGVDSAHEGIYLLCVFSFSYSRRFRDGFCKSVASPYPTNQPRVFGSFLSILILGAFLFMIMLYVGMERERESHARGRMGFCEIAPVFFCLAGWLLLPVSFFLSVSHVY